MISIKEDRRSRLRLMDQLNILSMSPAQQKRLVRRMGSQVRSDARANIRNQMTVSGTKMTPRANARTKRKLLRKMGKGMSVQVRKSRSATAVVSWKNTAVGAVAKKQQEGIPETFTPAKMKKINKRFEKPGFYDKPATKKQASALNKEGFKRRVARKRGKGKATLKRVPQTWIMSNMTIGQAGMILRLSFNSL